MEPSLPPPLVPISRLEDFIARVPDPVFAFLDTIDATRLRATSRTAREAVASHRWADADTPIRGSLSSWRSCFPRAVAANISGRRDLADAAFVHLEGLRTLDMNGCDQPSITDAAFVHLRGIHTLNMGGCSQRTITDAAFAHLRGIHTLSMHGCDQPGITDAAFVHLRGIHTLDIGGCDQRSFTAAEFTAAGLAHVWDIIKSAR
jgi:hypothetical protein